LCRAVAQDSYLPRPFAVAGHRLVFSVGIIYLAVMAAVLLILFGGITDHLIPLFAVGAFMTFTLSQTGMVMHWRRLLRKEPAHRQHRVHLWINGTGAVTTAGALLVICIAKFHEGAWITILAVPAVIVLLKSIRGYYDRLAAKVHELEPMKVARTEPPVVLVTIDDWNVLAERSMALAFSISSHVVGVHLSHLEGPDDNESYRELRALWHKNVVEPCVAAGLNPPPLVIMQAQYRAIHVPIVELTQQLEIKYPGRAIAIMVPELVKQHWYQRLLHTHRARHLRSQLRRFGDARITLIDVPWYLEEAPVAVTGKPAGSVNPEGSVSLL